MDNEVDKKHTIAKHYHVATQPQGHSSKEVVLFIQSN